MEPMCRVRSLSYVLVVTVGLRQSTIPWVRRALKDRFNEQRIVMSLPVNTKTVELRTQVCYMFW